MSNNTIKDEIDNGYFDFSKKEKTFTVLLIVAIGYFSQESCKVFKPLGRSGAHELPMGDFSVAEVANAAFWSNTALNFWLLAETAHSARTAYCYHRLSKKLDIPTQGCYKSVRFFIALIFAGLSGAVMGFIARESHTKRHSQEISNEWITGFVNTILSFLGANEIINAIEALANWITIKIEKCRHPNHTIPANAPINECTETDANSLEASNEHTSLLSGKNNKKTNKVLAATVTLHIIIQICDKAANYGFWKDTIKNTADIMSPHHNIVNKTHTTGEIAVGSIVFLPFLALSVLVMYKTTRRFIDLIETAHTEIPAFIRHPECSKKTITNATLLLISTALSGYCCYLSYLSSSVVLALNAENGWDEWWNTYPAVMGALLYTSFGFLSTIMFLYTECVKGILYNTAERKTLNDNSIFQDFMTSNTSHPKKTRRDPAMRLAEITAGS
jgi:hypothetical protein